MRVCALCFVIGLVCDLLDHPVWQFYILENLILPYKCILCRVADSSELLLSFFKLENTVSLQLLRLALEWWTILVMYVARALQFFKM